MSDFPCTDFDFRIKTPASVIFAGPSGSGKTQLVGKILLNAEKCFTEAPVKIFYFYACWQPVYAMLQSKLKHIYFVNALPENFDSYDKSTLLVLDDMMSQSSESLEILKLFTVYRHHKEISVFLLSQNIFCQGKYSRTISLNTHYYILFNNPRDKLQIRTLSQQIYPEDSRFLSEVYKDATSTPFNYLVLDLTQSCPAKFRLRSGLVGAGAVGGNDDVVTLYSRP